MTIPAIGPVTGVTGTGYLSAVQAPGPTDGSSFASSLTGAVDNLQSLQTTSQSLAVQAVTGNLSDIHTATLAATRAQVTLELVSAIRNKGVDGFNEIMRMQA
jgi:flagellar hook-basal body complex protein FliE